MGLKKGSRLWAQSSASTISKPSPWSHILNELWGAFHIAFPASTHWIVHSVVLSRVRYGLPSPPPPPGSGVWWWGLEMCAGWEKCAIVTWTEELVYPLVGGNQKSKGDTRNCHKISRYQSLCWKTAIELAFGPKLVVDVWCQSTSLPLHPSGHKTPATQEVFLKASIALDVKITISQIFSKILAMINKCIN